MLPKMMLNSARYIYGVPFIIFGLLHYFHADTMVSMVPTWLPVPMFWVYLVGFCLFIAGLSIVFKHLSALACQLLALLLLTFIITVHMPLMGVPGMEQMAMVSILKDMGLMGAALGFASMFERDL
ncbi:MAG: DoxX family protein [Actinobacteria bacterium]|nr:DoxX family protein [Actinomycetota bacterium]|tara:strand:+ start:738 stop:1112 length:375 start_codon:yes stop_codon:yes gene_type:complete